MPSLIWAVSGWFFALTAASSSLRSLASRDPNSPVVRAAWVQIAAVFPLSAASPAWESAGPDAAGPDAAGAEPMGLGAPATWGSGAEPPGFAGPPGPLE